jgi:hypothetical protein
MWADHVEMINLPGVFDNKNLPDRLTRAILWSILLSSSRMPEPDCHYDGCGPLDLSQFTTRPAL